MVRNIPSTTPRKVQGPRFTPRPSPRADTGGSDRAMLRGARTRAEAAPQSNIQANRDRYLPEVQAQQKRQFDMANRAGSDSGSDLGSDLGFDDAPPVPGGNRGKPSDIGWQDSAYNTQIAALERALRDFETGATTRGERYGQDFTKGLSSLGYQPGSGFQAMPNIVEAVNQSQATPAAAGAASATPAIPIAPVTGGQFDIEGRMGRTSAAARGTRGMRDEFAGRGTLRSSDFAKSFGDFQGRLNEQLQAMETGRGRFAEDLGTELSQFRSRTEEQKAAAEEAARNRAIMRAIQEMGF